MWDRKKLKEVAKEKFKANYWKCVLVALLFGMVVGGGYSGSSASFGNSFNNNSSSDSVIESFTDSLDRAADEVTSGVDSSGKERDDDSNDELFDEDDAVVEGAYNSAIGKDVRDAMESAKTANDELNGFVNKIKEAEPAEIAAFVVVIVLIVGMIVLIAIAIGLLIDAFLLNPLEVGCARFFYKNLSEPANVSNVAYGFDHSYKNGVRVMFYRDLYLILWSMLFVIPGIIKAYEYKMIPYLLAENPDMSKEEAFAESKRMMDGQKWNAFVLDLSFIGWDILSGFTAGLLSIFFVTPYKRSAQAALYDALRYGAPRNESEAI